MERNSRLKSKLPAILDKNLYGRSFFFTSFPYLIFGLVVQFFFFLYIGSHHMVMIYLPFYSAVVVVSGFAAKNYRKEFHPMGWWSTLLLLFASVLSKMFALTAPFSPIGFFSPLLQSLFVLGISESAFVVSLISVVVIGHRASLRVHVGLDDKFFEREKKRWQSELDRFPNLDKILEGLDGGRYVASLFDSGFFNLTILWCCNVMEEVIDAIAEGIIVMTPEKKALFRTEKGRRCGYPLQLRNLGYKSHLKRQKEKEFNVVTLWHKVRVKIAHRNYKPTFNETNETLKILISFMKEMPIILPNWKI